MSTTFGVKSPRTEREIEVAFQMNSGFVYWRNELAELLPDETPIIGMDNDTDLKTIGEVKAIIAEQDKLSQTNEES